MDPDDKPVSNFARELMYGPPPFGRMAPEDMPPPQAVYDEMLEHGCFHIPTYLSADYEAFMCEQACTQLDKALIPRNRKVEEWTNVERITLFKEPKGLRRVQGLERCSPTLANIEPEIITLVRLLGVNLGQMPNVTAKQLQVAAMLAGYSPTRLVINIMNGSIESPAIIHDHTDPPEESCVVAVATLDTLSDQPVGTISLYACRDLADLLGIDQPLHGVVAGYKRYSLALTDWPSDRSN